MPILSKHKKPTTMVRPGMSDSALMPSGGGSSSSGITLDYSAINLGGVDNGVPYNHADDEDERERLLQADQDVEMYDGWRNIKPGIEILPVNELLVSERVIARVLREIQEGRPSHSLNKPLLVREIGSTKKKVLEEGHHRLVQGLIHGLKFFPAAIMDVPEGTFGFSQAQQDPFVFEDTLFGGLERFADEDTLKQLAATTNFTDDTVEVNEADDKEKTDEIARLVIRIRYIDRLDDELWQKQKEGQLKFDDLMTLMLFDLDGEIPDEITEKGDVDALYTLVSYWLDQLRQVETDNLARVLGVSYEDAAKYVEHNDMSNVDDGSSNKISDTAKRIIKLTTTYRRLNQLGDLIEKARWKGTSKFDDLVELALTLDAEIPNKIMDTQNVEALYYLLLFAIDKHKTNIGDETAKLMGVTPENAYLYLNRPGMIEVNNAADLYSLTRETPSSLTKIPTETAQNSYVGRSEDMFPLRHNLDYGSSISTNAFLNIPQYSDPNMYEQTGESPRNTMEPEFNIFEQYFTDDEVEVPEEDEDEIEVKEKKAFPDWPQYNGSGLYEYVVERQDSNTTPHFDQWNTYAADDKEDVPYVCPRCEEDIKTQAELLGHMTTRHDMKPDTAEKYVEHAVKEHDKAVHKKQLEQAEPYEMSTDKGFRGMLERVLRDMRDVLGIATPDMSKEEERANNILDKTAKSYGGISLWGKIRHGWGFAFFHLRDALEFVRRVGTSEVADLLPVSVQPKTLHVERMYKTVLPEKRLYVVVVPNIVSVTSKINNADDKPLKFKPDDIVATIHDPNVRGMILPGHKMMRDRVFVPVRELIWYKGTGNPELVNYAEIEQPRIQWMPENQLKLVEGEKWERHYFDAAKQYPRYRFVGDKTNDIVEAHDTEETIVKEAFLKTAVTYDSNPVIQDLIKIPQVKSLIDQQASGFVDEIKVTTPSADISQTQQKIQQQPGQPPTKLDPISGDPYGHVWISQDPTTHQKKPLDKIVRIDKVTDAWGTLVTVLHEITHHRHPDWSESQVQTEAEHLAATVKQFMEPKNASDTRSVVFVKNNLNSLPVVRCELAGSYQKQVVGLQLHSSLRPDAGMVFNYARPSYLTFHMGKVAFPIDIVFADKDNEIIKIYRNCQPGSQEIYSCANATKVIEVVGSFCAFYDIDVGDHVFEADDEVYKKHDFTKYIFNRIQDVKLAQQKDLGMEDWNIRIVMEKDVSSHRFLKVDWSTDDYAIKKAEIIVNPNPLLIRAALKKMSLSKLVRHALLHILAGQKGELPEDKEHTLITKHLFKEARVNELVKRATVRWRDDPRRERALNELDTSIRKSSHLRAGKPGEPGPWIDLTSYPLAQYRVRSVGIERPEVGFGAPGFQLDGPGIPPDNNMGLMAYGPGEYGYWLDWIQTRPYDWFTKIWNEKRAYPIRQG